MLDISCKTSAYQKIHIRYNKKNKQKNYFAKVINTIKKKQTTLLK